MGKTWDETYNANLPTVMFDAVPNGSGNISASLSANQGRPDALVGATQDNGLVYNAAAGGDWIQLEGGDGYRADWVTDELAIMYPSTRWFTWDGATLTERGTLEPTPGFYLWILARVPHPRYTRGGALMVAIAGDNSASGSLYGLFDAKPGSTDSDRLRWETLASVPYKLSGIATWDGRTIVATTEGQPPAAGTAPTGRYYRVVPGAGPSTVDEFSTSVLVGRGPARLPTFLSRDTVLAVDNQGLVRSDGLATWRDAGAQPLPNGQSIFTFAVDTGPLPNVIYAGSKRTLYASNDGGLTWRPIDTLPLNPQLSQVRYTPAHDGTRRLHVATWNWSAWTATLQ
jgi:hypothetical protein